MRLSESHHASEGIIGHLFATIHGCVQRVKHEARTLSAQASSFDLVFVANSDTSLLAHRCLHWPLRGLRRGHGKLGICMELQSAYTPPQTRRRQNARWLG